MKKGYPKIIIGDAVLDFKKEYKGVIRKINDVADLREIVSYYKGINYLENDIVLEDFGFLPQICESVLLKFLEETSLNVILLYTYDKASSIILSRAGSVIKYYKDGIHSDFMKVKDGFKRMSESESDNYYSKIKEIASVCPKIYYLDKKIKSNKDKVLSILE